MASHVLMAAIEEALEPGDELKLAQFLTPLRLTYDFILIDNPPGKAMLAFNGLTAADLILVPIGFIAAAISGYLCLKVLLRFLQKNPTNVFVYYRWALAALIVVVAIVR